MKIGLFFPYGPQQRESASAFSLAAYVQNCGAEVTNIVCTGGLSACDLDKQSSWKRSRSACFNCQCAQAYTQDWAEFPSNSFSEFIDSEFIEQSRFLLKNLNATELLKINYAQVPMESICQGVYNKRFGKDFELSANAEELHFYRSLLINSLRVFYATRKMIQDLSLDLLIISAHEQFVSKAALLAASTVKCETLSIQSEQETGQTVMRHSAKESSFVCDMMISDISFVRRDINTWPAEFQKQISKLAIYIGAEDLQMSLPIQNAG